LEWEDEEKQCEVNETLMGKVSAGFYTDILPNAATLSAACWNSGRASGCR